MPAVRPFSRSYLGVNYELRPAKQVERRMIVDALHLLSLEGFQIRDYQYTGMGSIYFVDFIMFHRLLGIHRMLSVEGDRRISRRVQFNRPFNCVNVVMKKAGDVIADRRLLPSDLKHLVWLDYDEKLGTSQLADANLAASSLPRESILLVTVDVDPPGPEKDGPADWHDYFRDISGDLFDPALTLEDFAEGKLARVSGRLLHRAIDAGLSTRTHVEFIPLFSFDYADTHRMITVGGMIGASEERRRIRASGLTETKYYRPGRNQAPCRIEVPQLTRKERIWLDQHMPCAPGWSLDEFELRREDLNAYRDVYRYLPAYAELLL